MSSYIGVWMSTRLQYYCTVVAVPIAWGYLTMYLMDSQFRVNFMCVNYDACAKTQHTKLLHATAFLICSRTFSSNLFDY